MVIEATPERKVPSMLAQDGERSHDDAQPALTCRRRRARRGVGAAHAATLSGAAGQPDTSLAVNTARPSRRTGSARPRTVCTAACSSAGATMPYTRPSCSAHSPMA